MTTRVPMWKVIKEIFIRRKDTISNNLLNFRNVDNVIYEAKDETEIKEKEV